MFTLCLSFSNFMDVAERLNQKFAKSEQCNLDPTTKSCSASSPPMTQDTNISNGLDTGEYRHFLSALLTKPLAGLIFLTVKYSQCPPRHHPPAGPFIIAPVQQDRATPSPGYHEHQKNCLSPWHLASKGMHTCLTHVNCSSSESAWSWTPFSNISSFSTWSSD